MGFGETLRRLREDAGMTQEDVANRLGISGQAVGAWENGRSRPRLEKLNQLARLLGVDASDLVDMRDVCCASCYASCISSCISRLQLDVLERLIR